MISEGKTMVRVSTGRSELEVQVSGEGEPVLTIHGIFTGYAFDAMCRVPLLSNQYRMIFYHRHNYGHSAHAADPYTVQDETKDALEVLRQIGGGCGHVVAHSGGAPKALQLLLDHPDAVQSLTLIEPVLPTPEFAEFHGRVSGKVGEAYASGDQDNATRMFMAAVYGSDDFREHLDPVLPADWWERCVADLGYMLTVEGPGASQWSFGPEEGARITHPVLLLEGAETIPMFHANNQYFKRWVPHTEEKIIPGVNHFLQFLRPKEVAHAIEPFLQRHSAG